MFSGLHVVDGGLGMELIRRGVIEEGDPLWSAKALIKNPDSIREVHGSYLQKGANIILTASYQASVPGFCRYANCCENEARDLIGKSVALAKQACTDFIKQIKHSGEDQVPSFSKLIIGGSIGPYGACLFDRSEYHGNYIDDIDIEELKSWHRTRCEILVNAGVDFVAIETIPSLAEAVAILDVLKEFPNTPCWVTFSCKDDSHICHGETFYEAATTVAACDQVKAVGVNCTSPVFIQGLLSKVNRVVHKPLVVYPNIDSCRSVGKSFLSPYVPIWMDHGATIIGGCCGSTPEDIDDISQAMMSCNTR